MEEQKTKNGLGGIVPLIPKIATLIMGFFSIICMFFLGVKVKSIYYDEVGQVVFNQTTTIDLILLSKNTDQEISAIGLIILAISMVFAVALGIILLIKTIKNFKKDFSKIESVSITCYLAFITWAVIFRSIFVCNSNGAWGKSSATYSVMPIIGMVVGGICLAILVITKINENAFGQTVEKEVMLNLIFNGAIAVITIVTMCLMASPAITVNNGIATQRFSFMQIETNRSLKYIGFVLEAITIAFLSAVLHKAIDGIMKGENYITPVYLSTTIGLTLFIMICAILVSKSYEYGKASAIIVIFAFVFSVVNVVISSVHSKKLNVTVKPFDPTQVSQTEQENETGEKTTDENGEEVIKSEPASIGSNNPDDDSFGTFTF
ncbi:MAG: hypothetical protein ACI4MS_01565 [Candidatus Coproplasma sp.]